MLQYAVVKGVISPEKAKYYEDEMYKWLESFGLGKHIFRLVLSPANPSTGFKGDDRSTWRIANVPYFDKGGLYHKYGVGHEQFAWDIRAEPGVVDAFARLWGTPELIVSYDSTNISLPLGAELNADRVAPWPHVDQSPTRTFLHCVQGIVNLHENGPKDGGLTVLAGSTPLFEEYFATHPHLKPEDGWPTADWWGHAEAELQWFYDHGCEWVKVEAGPGDLILWDSRTVHYGAAAEGTEPRVATYVCYKPAKDMSEEKLKLKQECFEKYWGTSHDPLEFRITAARFKPHWDVKDGERTEPRTKPVLSERTKQLAGLVPY